MPYEVKKDDKGWYLKNAKTGVIVNKRFKTIKTAVSAGKNWLRYRGEKATVNKNRIG